MCSQHDAKLLVDRRVGLLVVLKALLRLMASEILTCSQFTPVIHMTPYWTELISLTRPHLVFRVALFKPVEALANPCIK